LGGGPCELTRKLQSSQLGEFGLEVSEADGGKMSARLGGFPPSTIRSSMSLPSLEPFRPSLLVRQSFRDAFRRCGCDEMALQRSERIESGDGNGVSPEASNP